MNRYVRKILSIIAQDGLFRAIGIMFEMAHAHLKYPKSADVLFVSSGAVGDSWRFRVENVAEELELNGFSSSIFVQENVWLKTCADKFQVFVFHRVKSSPAVSYLIEEIKKQKKEIIFETDDLVFDFDLFKQQDSYKRSNVAEQEFCKNVAEKNILNDPYVKVCTTTTTFLAEKLRDLGKKVFIVPNKLSKSDVEIANKIMDYGTRNMKQKCSMPHAPCSMIKLGYFSGTLSHNKDFATITDALGQVMEKHENVELFLVGPLDLESELNKFSDRIKQFPYVTREKHFANVASVDINLVPLELGNPFCEAKSELKFFEAGIVGVPTIAVANQTYMEAIEDGRDGFIAGSTEQWVEKLEKLIADENLRKAMGQKAREKALAKYTTEKADNTEYYNYLRSRISK